MGLDWDDANLEHVARHGVEPAEVEEALEDPDRISIGARRDPSGERRRAVVGRTENSRILTVFLTLRDGHLRPVTARDADEAERRRYRR